SPAKTSDTGSLPVGIGMMRVSVSVANIDYPHLKKLLGLIEHNLRLTDVQDLSFNPAEKTAALHLSTYYFKK
ncbi:MAG TPA: hypothetical protein PKI61_03525, partial [bacterium]|nr:hypothetical protein [bacterium]